MKVLNLFKVWKKHTHMSIRQGYMRWLLLLLLFLGLSNTSSYADELKPLKLCALPMFSEITKEQAELAMTDIFNRQVGDLGIKLSFKLYSTPEEILNGFDEGECDGMVATPVEILARKSKLDNLIIAVADWTDKSTNVYNYEVVTNIMNANTLEDLEGKALAYVFNRTFSKTYLDYSLLKLKRKTINSFFRVITEKKDPQAAIMDVFFGKADAAIVDQFSFETAKELNPQINKKLKVILKSPPFYNTVIGVRNSAKTHFPLAHQVFARTPEKQLSLEKLDTTFAKKNGRGLAFKLESLELKDLSEMEAIIKEINTMKKTIK